MCALKAKAIMHRDKDYVVKDGEVIIVDEFTGRLMFGRRFRKACIRLLKLKKVLKLSVKVRLWRLLPSRTISVCMKNFPV